MRIGEVVADDILMRVEGLTRRYGELLAVDKITFTLARGQVLGFLGPNGAGKSTTMRMLAGVLAPDAGRIVIAGNDLFDQPIQAKRAIGYLPEHPPLYRELTVDEQLLYSAHLHGMSRAIRCTAVARAKVRCGLTEVGKRLNGNLSKGYRQRVGIAQAILHDPPVIVLDEPTAGLDPLQLHEVRCLISELSKQHGVILSTHLLAEVQTTCSHVQIMRAGRLVYAGALAELEARQQSTCLRITLDMPPPLADLSQLPSVEQVETLGPGRFRLHHSPGRSPHQTIVERSAREGWGLCELVAERANLEQVFIELALDQETAAP